MCHATNMPCRSLKYRHKCSSKNPMRSSRIVPSFSTLPYFRWITCVTPVAQDKTKRRNCGCMYGTTRLLLRGSRGSIEERISHNSTWRLNITIQGQICTAAQWIAKGHLTVWATLLNWPVHYCTGKLGAAYKLIAYADPPLCCPDQLHIQFFAACI